MVYFLLYLHEGLKKKYKNCRSDVSSDEGNSNKFQKWVLQFEKLKFMNFFISRHPIYQKNEFIFGNYADYFVESARQTARVIRR